MTRLDNDQCQASFQSGLELGQRLREEAQKHTTQRWCCLGKRPHTSGFPHLGAVWAGARAPQASLGRRPRTSGLSLCVACAANVCRLLGMALCGLHCWQQAIQKRCHSFLQKHTILEICLHQNFEFYHCLEKPYQRSCHRLLSESLWRLDPKPHPKTTIPGAAAEIWHWAGALTQRALTQPTVKNGGGSFC